MVVLENIQKYCKSNNKIICLFIIFLIEIYLKSIYVLDMPAPLIFGDEVLYKGMSQSLFERLYYDNLLYPPGYPLVLAVSFFMDYDFYQMMKLINVLLISSTIFPAWKIARVYLPEKESFACAIILSLFPALYVMPRYIMSENLYYFLFMIAVYYYLKIIKENRNSSYIVLGIVLGIMHLTRHFSLVITMGFFLALFLDVNFYKNPLRWINHRRLQKSWILLLSYSCMYTPWIAMGCLFGHNLYDIVGLSISSVFKSDKADMRSLLVWINYYGTYLLAMVLPVVPALLYLVSSIRKKKCLYLFSKFLWLIIFVTVMSLAAAIRHSWLQGYNYPQPAYIIGRYIMYSAPLIFIAGWIVHCSIWEKSKKNLIYAVGWVFSVYSFYILLHGKENSIFHLNYIRPYYEVVVPDLAYLIHIDERIIILLFIFLLLMISFSFCKNHQKNIDKIWIVCTVSFYLIGSFLSIQVQDYNGIHGKVMLDVVEAERANQNFGPYTIYDDVGIEQSLLANWGFYNMEFQDVSMFSIQEVIKKYTTNFNENFVLKKSVDYNQLNQPGMLVTDKKIPWKRILKEYQIKEKKYYIYQII